MSTAKLEWLFTAAFKDGHVIKQTKEDVSEDGKGSAFTDVMQYDGELKYFDIRNTENLTSLALDLSDGMFTIDGIEFGLHEQGFDPTEHELKLIYFRETVIQRDIVDGEPVEDRHFVNRYFVGWQAVGTDIKHMVHV